VDGVVRATYACGCFLSYTILDINRNLLKYNVGIYASL
jgi:hypothetical protein